MNKESVSKFVVCSFIVAMTLIGCETKRENPINEKQGETKSLKSIIGNDGRVWAESHNDEKKFSKIAQINVRNSHKCSGVFLSENIILTSLHCVSDKSKEDITVNKLDGEIRKIRQIFKIDENRDLAWMSLLDSIPDLSREDDFLVGLENNSFDETGDDLDVDIFGYDPFENKFFHSHSETAVQHLRPGFISYDADTVPGASGSPIFIRGKLVGIHLGSLSTQGKIKNFGALLSEKSTASLDELKLLYDIQLERDIEMCGIVLGSVNIFTYYACYSAIVIIPPSCASGVGLPVCGAAIGVAAGLCGLDAVLLWKAIDHCFK